MNQLEAKGGVPGPKDIFVAYLSGLITHMKEEEPVIGEAVSQAERWIELTNSTPWAEIDFTGELKEIRDRYLGPESREMGTVFVESFKLIKQRNELLGIQHNQQR